MNRYWTHMKAAGVVLALCAGASPAWAGGYCSDKEPCKLAMDTCNGHYCVPTAKLCTSDSSCAAWEKCDFTCPSGIGGGGSTSTGGGTTTSSDVSPNVTYADAGSSGSGGGGGGAPWADGGSTPPQPWDAGSGGEDQAWGPDGISFDDASAIDPGFQPDAYQSNCPASPGVCVPVLSKVPAQAGCEEFCAAMVPCHLFGGSGSSSGGSSGSGGGGESPKPDMDAGSTEPFYPDAGAGGGGGGGVPEPFDASTGYDTNMPMVDAGPAPDEKAQCMALCSLLKVSQAAPAEFTALETCIAGAGTDCKAIESTCEKAADAFMKAAEANDAWSLGMGGSMSTGANSEAGGGKGGDGTPVFGSDGGTQSGTLGDTSSSAPQASMDSSGGGASSSGCTAAPGTTNASGLGLLGLLAAGALVLRRRVIG